MSGRECFGWPHSVNHVCGSQYGETQNPERRFIMDELWIEIWDQVRYGLDFIRLAYLPVFWHLWWPHLLVWATGVIYFRAQRGKPAPRLGFDIPWRVFVALTGARIIFEAFRHSCPFPWGMGYIWVAGTILFIYGE